MKERESILSEALQREALINASVKRTFGFVPHLNQNAVKLYQSHPSMPSNMSFCDLTYNKSAPPYAKFLLGLGSKFVPTPARTTGLLSSTFSRLTRDLKLRVYFACDVVSDLGEEEEEEEEEEDRPKLYVKSKWTPEVE